MSKMAMALILLALVAGCTRAPPPHSDPAAWIHPSQAVQRAAAASRTGVTGLFVLTVRSTGKRVRTFLDSEADYRDQRNLAVAIVPGAAAGLQSRLGAPPDKALGGRRILVSGTARRVRIDFTQHRHPTGNYYYQTQLLVTAPSQIRVLGDAGGR